MNDLTEFLTARLNEDEAAATAAAGCDGGDLAWFDSRVVVSGDHTIRTREGNRPACRIRRDDVVGRWGQTMDPDAAAAHIARHDPARVLREVEAKRAILARHAPNPEHSAFCGRCNDGLLEQHWPCPDVLDIAAIYSDHPGYRQEWKP